jgi:hypothetical protein
MRSSTARLLRVAVVAGLFSTAAPALAQKPKPPASAVDEGPWHLLAVPGGRTTFATLGITDVIGRSEAIIEIVRRLHFAPTSPVEREAALLNVSLAMADLDRLLNAVAIGSSPGQPMTLAMATQKNQRSRLEDALDFLGLDLRERDRAYGIELKGGDEAAALRARLLSIGLDSAALMRRLTAGGALTVEIPSVTVPLPLSPRTWTAIFERDIPARRLFAEIVTDPNARLLYHGLAGLDEETRRWMAGQPDLLKRIYRDGEAVRSFSLFAPALRISGGKVVPPGGPQAAQRWSTALDVNVNRVDRFVRRLFDDRGGRTAGLYFTIASVDAARRSFLLGTGAGVKDGNDRFRRLVASFAQCYPDHATAYPFALRSHDAAVLLLDVAITPEGELAGPQWRKFWSKALSDDNLPANPEAELRELKEDGTIDAAWMVDRLCEAPSSERGKLFVSLLAGHRMFRGIADADLPAALIALRARRQTPAVIMALEQARVRQPKVFAAVARHAALLRGLDGPQAITALQQFQAAIALTVEAVEAGALRPVEAESLFASLGAVPLDGSRYDGAVAAWLTRQWIPAVVSRLPSTAGPEEILLNALAGVNPPAGDVIWEGETFVLDFQATRRERLAGVRKHQGGASLDAALALFELANELRQPTVTLAGVKQAGATLNTLAPKLLQVVPADEFGNEVPNLKDKLGDTARDLQRIDSDRDLRRAADAGRDLLPLVDFVLGHVLASWAYTPHLGDPDGPALVAGDPSRHHVFGATDLRPSARGQRWEVATFANEGAGVAGSLLGLDAGLARWSLRRLANDAVPQAPTLIANDFVSMLLAVTLSDPHRVSDEGLRRIADTSAKGTAAIAAARGDAAALRALSERTALSPWTREQLAWMVAEEPERIDHRFSVIDVLRIGGFDTTGLDGWGSASLLSGCLCLRLPEAHIPDLIVGRAADGLLGSHSADLTLRVAVTLAELKLPAALVSPVLTYAMRDYIDRLAPSHTADFAAFTRQAWLVDRRTIEDYIGAIAAVGPLRPKP